MNSERPLGQRFSLVYEDPGEPTYQSVKLQRRAASFFSANFEGEGFVVANALQQELGARWFSNGYSHWQVAEWLERSGAAEFMEAITVVAAALHSSDRSSRSVQRGSCAKWVAFVERAAREENWKYELDEAGGVHPRIDPAFTVERGAMIKHLNAGRYATARGHFEAAHAALDERPPATGRAIREVFLANETVFKLLSPQSNILDANEAMRRLPPILETQLSGPELHAARETSKGLADYVNGSHQYRHAQATDPQPSLDTAVMMISVGTAWLRWLLALDQSTQSAGDQG